MLGFELGDAERDSPLQKLCTSELSVAMFLVASVCESLNALHWNRLSAFGNVTTLCVLVGGRPCLKIEKLKTPLLSALLSVRDLAFVN